MFPEPEALRPAVDFWTRIYAKVPIDGGVLHDERHLGLVYENMRFSGQNSDRQIDTRKQYWRGVLNRLAKGGSPRDDAERKVVQQMARVLKRAPTSRDFEQAGEGLRFQRGHRERFMRGVARSGAYERELRAILRQFGLPEELVYLPHVESSFVSRVYSKQGATGMWQFMRETGNHYLVIDDVLDERLDPFKATRAAARLLRRNYTSLGNWPLAIAAYHHGASGMARARKSLGTSDIATIIERYRGPYFGFASRNYYVQFLAARAIAREYWKYFGALEKEPPRKFDKIMLPFFADASHLERFLGVNRATLAKYNPSLLPSVLRSEKWIPAGFTLRLPAGTMAPNEGAWLASMPPQCRYPRQRRDAAKNPT
jgi:membrane-bound lytic murein transglycosylase D